MSIFMAKRKKKNDNPMTLLDFIIIAGPLMMLLIISLIGYFVK